MASNRVLAVQARLDAARDKLQAELDKGAARDKSLVTSYEKSIEELKDELKLHALTAGELVFMYLLGTQSSGIEGLPSSFYIAVLACRSWLTCMSHSI